MMESALVVELVLGLSVLPSLKTRPGTGGGGATDPLQTPLWVNEWLGPKQPELSQGDPRHEKTPDIWSQGPKSKIATGIGKECKYCQKTLIQGSFKR